MGSPNISCNEQQVRQVPEIESNHEWNTEDTLYQISWLPIKHIGLSHSIYEVNEVEKNITKRAKDIGCFIKHAHKHNQSQPYFAESNQKNKKVQQLLRPNKKQWPPPGKYIFGLQQRHQYWNLNYLQNKMMFRDKKNWVWQGRDIKKTKMHKLKVNNIDQGVWKSINYHYGFWN